MASEFQISHSSDPLEGYSTLSLFPRTFRVSTDDPKNPSHKNLDDDGGGMDFIHTYLKSVALSSPLKLQEQARTIVDRSGSGLLNSNIPSYVVFKDDIEVVASKDKGNPQERRPGLGHKRARFSFKPNYVQPSVSLVPSLDTAKLQDPVEYFLAHKNIENAKKEIQRQTGSVLVDLDQHKTSRIARQRRPGILGKSASYRHNYPSTVSNKENFLTSQEIFEPDIPTPSSRNFQQEPTDLKVASLEKESSDSVTKAEQKVSELLDELLSVNCEDLEGDDAVTLLQERLQIRPIDVGKMHLPNFHEFQRSDFTVLGETLPKRRNALADIQNTLTRVSNKTPVKHKQLEEISVHSLASPTPPKSPLAYINSLKKRIMQSNTSVDPFASQNIDPLPAKNYSPTEGNHDQSGHVDDVDKLCDSGKLMPPMVEKDVRDVAKMGSDNASTDDLACHIENPVDDNGLNKSINSFTALNITTAPARSFSPIEGNHDQYDHVDFSERLSDSGKSKPLIVEEDGISIGKMGSLEALTNDSTRASKEFVDRNFNRPGIDVLSSGCHDSIENDIRAGNTKDMVIDNNLSSPEADSDIQTNEHARSGENGPSFRHENLAGGLPQEPLGPAQQDSNMESAVENLFGQSSPAAVEPSPVDDRPSKPPENNPEQHIEEPLAKTSTKKRKPKAPSRKRKELSGRQSLAGAGTLWQSGVRRSTRIKSRPLEYWKGERFLYGRVHDSLATVIGLKYVSPAKGGDKEPTIRVKSYVSDEYKELVEQAALH